MIPLWSQIFTLLLASAIVSFLAAVVIKAAMQWVGQKKVLFLEALTAALAGTFPIFMLLVLAQSPALKTAIGEVAAGGIVLLTFPLGFLTQSAAIRWRFRVTFGRACLVSLVIGGIGLGILILAGGAMALLVRHKA